MPVVEGGGRYDQMAKSLGTAARGVGLAEPEVELIRRTFVVAMAPRLATLADDHDPAFLHPGRSMLILFHDVGRVDVTAAVVAALHDSIDVDLYPMAPDVRDQVASQHLEALERIPLPGDERLLEKLVGLPEAVALAALAERLDQLRHLHLRPETRPTWSDMHVEVGAAWEPLAQRCHPRLATRYAHWSRVFAKRMRLPRP